MKDGDRRDWKASVSCGMRVAQTISGDEFRMAGEHTEHRALPCLAKEQRGTEYLLHRA